MALNHIAGRRAVVVAAGTIGGGLIWGVAGSGWGAVPICIGLWLLGYVDRRLMVLAAIALLPGLTAFGPLLVATIQGSPLDFRLLMTGGLAAAVGYWVVVDRVRPDAVGMSFLAFVAAIAALAILNDEEPLRSLPVVGRFTAYLVVLVGCTRWFSAADAMTIGAAIIVGAAVPAMTAVAQAVGGDALFQNAADRLTGVYRTSPVGLALAMQLALLAIATSRAFRGRPRDPVAWVAIALFCVYVWVLTETTTRLVFASCVAGLVLVELLRPRWRAVPVVLLGAAVVLSTQPDLVGRLASTGSPSATKVATPAPGLTAPPPEQSPEPGEASRSEPTRGRGDTSLSFRIFVWRVMIGAWQDSPVVGLGTGTFATILEKETGLKRIAPHNDYLGILVENGLVGLAMYLVFQIGAVLALSRRLRGSRVLAHREILIAALTVFLTSNVLNVLNNAILYGDLQTAVMALLGAALAVPPAPQRDQPVRRSSHGGLT